jgi:hypothetical protein
MLSLAFAPLNAELKCGSTTVASVAAAALTVGNMLFLAFGLLGGSRNSLPFMCISLPFLVALFVASLYCRTPAPLNAELDCGSSTVASVAALPRYFRHSVYSLYQYNSTNTDT